MSFSQIKSLADHPLFNVASHGFYHNNLASISLANAKKELIDSKEFLEKITEKEIYIIAYPDGSYSKDVTKIAREVGYKKQLLVAYNNPQEKDIPDLVERFTINPYISSHNQVLAAIKNKYL